MNPWLADPWIAAQIDAAMEPYRGLWPEEAFAIFREEMALTLVTHPTAMRLCAEARPKTVEPSGEVRVTGSSPEDATFTSLPVPGKKAGSW